MTQTVRRHGCGVAAVVAALLTTGLGGTARGQDLESFDRVAARVKLGATIKVTCTDGRELKGRLTQLSPSTLDILSKGTTTELRAGEIRSIYRQKPKPWTRNVLIGLGAGAALGFAAAPPGDHCLVCGPGFTVFAMGLTGGIGAGIGALFAAATSERSTLVYDVKTASSSVQLGVSPVVTPRRQGVMLTVRF